MRYLLRDIIWHKWRGSAAAVIALLAAYSAIIENGFPDAGLPTMKDFLPVWGWWIWALIGLALLLVATFVLAYQQNQKLRSHDNWIVAHQACYGKLPSIPRSLLSLIDNYTEGEPLSKSIKLKECPRHQQWGGLTDENRERFLQIMDWQGLDRYDFLQNMRDSAPPGGSAITQLHRKRKEE